MGDENIILNVYVKGSNFNFDINDFSLSGDLNPSNAYSDNENAVFNKILNYLYRLNINLENININIKLNDNSWLNFQVKNFSLSTVDEDFYLAL